MKVSKFASVQEGMPETVYNKEFLADLMDVPVLIRNVALCGQLHAGKTVLLDMLVEQTHQVGEKGKKKKKKKWPYFSIFY